MKQDDDRLMQVRQIIHDTLSQSLFAASTLSGVLMTQVETKSPDVSRTAAELHTMLQDAVAELKGIQTFLHEATDED